MSRTENRLFPAVLKYWRRCRGMSQLDLALEADVSGRHLSFLETGRAQPSREMVLRLCAVLGVPLRDQNTMLTSAGFAPAFEESQFERGFPPQAEHAITRMAAQQEPFPLLILNRCYDILRMNAAAERIIPSMVADPNALERPMNLLRMLFDERLVRPFVLDWESVALTMLSRLHRETLARPADSALMELVGDLLNYPGVPKTWNEPDLSGVCEATCALRLERGDLRFGFLTTITVFSAPQNVTIDEIRIESYFPLDDATAELCAQLAKPSRA